MKESRRNMLKIAVSAIVAGAVAGVGGFFAGTAAVPPAVETVTKTTTVTETITAPPITVTRTVPKVPVKTVKIGGIFPFTMVPEGSEMSMRGWQMAIDELNAEEWGGFRWESVWVDIEDQAPDKVVAAIERLVTKERVHSICGWWAGFSGFEYDIIAKYGIPYLHLDTSTACEEKFLSDPTKYWSCFQLSPPSRIYGVGAGKFLYQLIEKGLWEPENKKFAVLSPDNPYSIDAGKNFRELMEKMGWTVVLDEVFPPEKIEWTPELIKLKEKKPSIIYRHDSDPRSTVSFVKQFAESPIDALIFSGWICSFPEVLGLMGPSANGILWAMLTGTTNDEIGEAFNKKYMDYWDVEYPPAPDAGVHYSIVHAYAFAVCMAGDPTDYRKVCAMLRGLRDKHLTAPRFVFGGLSFNPAQCTYSYPWEVRETAFGGAHNIWQVQEEQNVQIFPPPWDKGKFQLPPWFRK